MQRDEDEEDNDTLSLVEVLCVVEVLNRLTIPESVAYIDLSQNKRCATDPFVSSLVALVPGCEVIELQNCNEITDATLHAIGYYCENLNVINVSGCKRLSYAAVTDLADACEDLMQVLGCGVVLCDDMLEDMSEMDPTELAQSSPPLVRSSVFSCAVFVSV